MVLDIIILLAALLGFYRGFKKGIISSALSFVGIIAGIILALKFSHVASVYIEQWLNISSKALPLISFVVVFIGVLFGLKLVGNIIEKILKTVSLNFINKIAGGAVWLLIVLMVFSTFFWFLNKVDIINLNLKDASLTYDYVEPVAPFVIDSIVKIFPGASGLFESIEDFFNNLPL